MIQIQMNQGNHILRLQNVPEKQSENLLEVTSDLLSTWSGNERKQISQNIDSVKRTSSAYIRKNRLPTLLSGAGGLHLSSAVEVPQAAGAEGLQQSLDQPLSSWKPWLPWICPNTSMAPPTWWAICYTWSFEQAGRE